MIIILLQLLSLLLIMNITTTTNNNNITIIVINKYFSHFSIRVSFHGVLNNDNAMTHDTEHSRTLKIEIFKF